MFTVNKRGKSALQWDKVVDSQNKESFGSGSMRDSQDMKGRYDLIPTGPIHRLAQHYENGAAKYAERNWEKGQPLSQYYNSAIRHLQALRDADLSEDHAAAAVWNIVAIMHHVDEMLKGTLPDHLDSFGILKAIRKEVERQQTLEQVRQAFNNTERKSIPLFPDGEVKYITSGTPMDYDPFQPLVDYSVPDGVKVVYDKDRFPQRTRRTVKLDPEELG
jgi:hypothetical protein